VTVLRPQNPAVSFSSRRGFKRGFIFFHSVTQTLTSSKISAPRPKGGSLFSGVPIADGFGVAPSYRLLSIDQAFVRDRLPRVIQVKPIQGFEFGIDL